MKDETKLKVLRILMVAVGVFSIGGIPLVLTLWPAGWQWQPSHSAYEGMIAVIYVSLAICLIWAAWDPIRHIMIIWFTIISSFLHGGIMAVYAVIDKGERLHLLGDVPFLLAVAVLFLLFIPWKLLKQGQKKA